MRLTVSASAVGMRVLDATILPAPGQQIVVMATGVAQVAGVNLQIQVGDGGALVGGTDVAGVDAAPITGVDFQSGSIWEQGTVGLEIPNLHGLIAFPVFMLGFQPEARASTPGKIATLILDGTGLTPGLQFPVALEIPGAVARSNFGIIAADELVPGTITVVPEPAVWLVAVFPILRRHRPRFSI